MSPPPPPAAPKPPSPPPVLGCRAWAISVRGPSLRTRNAHAFKTLKGNHQPVPRVPTATPPHCHTACAGNRIGDAGCKELAEALKENRTLTSVNLCSMFCAQSQTLG